jgi:hypothetical protein
MLRCSTQAASKNRLKVGLLLLLTLILWQIGVQPAKAVTLQVCLSGCTYSTIQAAINAASNGDTLEFPTNKETYQETITLNKSLTFVGQTTTINADNSGTAVTINGTPNVIMQNMIIQNGIGTNGAGLLLTNGSLTLTNVSFNGNDATNGGALYIASTASTVQLTDVTMQLNTAVNFGGAIYNNGTLTADDLTLTDNTAADGGGIYNSGTARIESQSSIQRNIAYAAGGGIFNNAGADFTLISNDLSNNDAVNGAAIYNEGSLQVTSSNLGSSNEATQTGGGLFNNGQATLTNSAVLQNDAVTGAGIYNEGTLIANNSTISRNEGANGAGLYNDGGTATFNNVTIHLTIGTSIFANSGTVSVGNTIISSVSGQTACGGGGTFNSNGYNLANDLSCPFLTALGDLQGLNPDLNGINSSTDSAAYHTPKLTSPVIDSGNPTEPGSSITACQANDQRGLPRPQSNRCDIGAVEIIVYRLFVPVVTK